MQLLVLNEKIHQLNQLFELLINKLSVYTVMKFYELMCKINFIEINNKLITLWINDLQTYNPMNKFLVHYKYLQILFIFLL